MIIPKFQYILCNYTVLQLCSPDALWDYNSVLQMHYATLTTNTT